MKRINLSKNKKGVVLVLAMFIMVFIAIFAVAFLELLASDLQITSNHQGRQKALYIADAGVEYAVSRLRMNKGWTATSLQTIFPTDSNSSWSITYPKAGTSRTVVSEGSLDNNKYAATIEAKISIQGSASPYNIRVVRRSEL